MGQVVKLLEVIENIEKFNLADTIYASEPWTEDSDSIVANEPPGGRPPLEAVNAGLKYFLEVSIAKDFIEDWSRTVSGTPNSSSICKRVIQYAINDA
jgi:hypothetical protein